MLETLVLALGPLSALTGWASIGLEFLSSTPDCLTPLGPGASPQSLGSWCVHAFQVCVSAPVVCMLPV